MLQAVIVAHPNPDSFTLSVARAYAEAAEAAGGTVAFRDLYAMNFDPCLKRDEIPSDADYRIRPDIAAERAVLEGVGLYVLVYPFWVNAPPAILKGYIDRVMGFGFGFSPDGEGRGPQLTGKRLLSLTSSGAPRHWVVDTGAFSAVRNLFDTHLAKVCGLTVVDHIHFGAITPNMTAAAVERHLDLVRNTAKWINRDN
jgi:NAD(P)H dehydrogenase (quinone)